MGRILLALLSKMGPHVSLPELLCRDAQQRLPVTGVALTLADGHRLVQPIASSDPGAAQLQALQFELGEGPCLDAMSSGRLLQVADVARDGLARWPLYARAVLELGTVGLASFPLQVGAIRLGVLDVFHDHTDGLGDEDLAAALHFADAAVLVLLHLQSTPALEASSAGWLDEVFDASLRDQAEVHQASGMVSVQTQISLAESLTLLRAHAFAHNITLLETAELIINRTLRFNRGLDGTLTKES